MRHTTILDILAISEIEEWNFGPNFGYEHDDLMEVFYDHVVVFLSAKINKKLVGYAMAERKDSCLDLFNISVHPDFFRQGVGTALIEEMKRHMGARSRIVCYVLDLNLPAHLFLKKQGFRASAIVKNHFAEVDRDAYLFYYDRMKENVVSGGLTNVSRLNFESLERK